MERALVLGADGLLGSNLCKSLESHGIYVIGTSKNQKSTTKLGVRIETFKIGDSLDALLSKTKPTLIYNCTVAKESFTRMSFRNIRSAYYVNTYFPKLLLRTSLKRGVFVFGFSTDAVFSKRRKPCDENDYRMPTTVYGLTKMLGEFSTTSSLLLRFSMVATKDSILSKEGNFSSQIINLPKGATFSISSKPNWNGVTLNALVNLVTQLSLSNTRPTGVRHFFSSSTVSKFELAKLLAKHYSRQDLKIIPRNDFSQNSELMTRHYLDHVAFWGLVGYRSVPSIRDLILPT